MKRRQLNPKFTHIEVYKHYIFSFGHSTGNHDFHISCDRNPLSMVCRENTPAHILTARVRCFCPRTHVREAFFTFFWFPSTHGRQNKRAGGRLKKKKKNEITIQ